MSQKGKAIQMRQLRPMGLESPGRLTNVDVYEIYVRITPVRYYEMAGVEGEITRAERRGESFGCVSYVAEVCSTESGALLAMIRQMLRQIVEGFFGVNL
jgi:hypothetical protein